MSGIHRCMKIYRKLSYHRKKISLKKEATSVKMDCSLIASDGGENWAINFYANRHPRNEQQRKSERPKLLFSFSQCACSWCVNLIEFKLSFRLNLCCLFSSLSLASFFISQPLAIWMCIRDQHIKNSFLSADIIFMHNLCLHVALISVFTMTIF